MIAEMYPTEVTYNALIHACARRIDYCISLMCPVIVFYYSSENSYLMWRSV